MADRTVAVNLIARVTGYKAGIDSAIRSTKQFGGELDGMRKSNAAGMHSITSTATIAGAALLGLAGWAVKVGMAFDKQMSAVSAVTGATAGELDQLRQAALKAGKDTVFSATEAAKAEEELAKAGISTADIMGGALTGSLMLASAGSLELAEAADVSAKAMNIWSLSGRDVGHIADVLAASANKSATDVHEMGMALKMGGLAAKTAGLTLEDTVGTLSAFADRALVGSDAGTSLKTMFMMLSNPTAKSAEKMKELGISVYDAGGNFVGVEKLAGILQTRLSGLTQQQRQAALATIFGSDATRAATVLYEEGAAGIHDYIASVNDAGAAMRAANEKTNNLAGDVERLKGAIETLTITSGEGANGGLRMIVQVLDHLVSTVSSLPAPVLTAVTVLAALSGGGLLAMAAFLKVRGVIADVSSAMAKAGPVTARFGTGLTNTAKWAGRASLALGALFIVAQTLDALRGPAVKVDQLATALENLGESGEKAGEISRIFGDDLTGFGTAVRLLQDAGAGFSQAVENVIPGMSSLNDAINGVSFSDATDQIEAVDEALAAMMSGGHAEQARKSFAALMQANHLSAEDMYNSLPKYQAAEMALGKIPPKTDVVAESMKTATAQANLLGGSFADAATAAGGLNEAFKVLHGGTLTADEAMLAAKKAVDDVGEAFKASGGKIKGNSEEALTNRIAMGKAAEAAANAAQTYLDLTGDVGGAARIMNDQRVAAEKAAIANGGNAKQVKAMGDEMFKLPKNKAVKFDMPGYLAAMQHLRDIALGLNNLHDKTVRVSVVTSSGGRSGGMQAQRWGGITQHAAGGLINAGVYSPVSPARYAFAEPQTGGEAFIPRLGNKARSMGILKAAAGWLNADVVPRQWAGAGPGGGGGAGGSAPMALTVNLTVDGNGKAVRKALITDAKGRNVGEATIRVAYP